jgi:hypothetical protein
MRPCGPFSGWREQIEILARELIEPLQTPADSPNAQQSED